MRIGKGQKEVHVGLEEYERVYDDLLRQARPGLKGLVLMTPFFVEPDRREPMRARMDQYGDAVRRLAARHDAVCVDLQGAFDRMLAHLHPMSLAWDRVHPNQAGHMVIARAFLTAVGFAW